MLQTLAVWVSAGRNHALAIGRKRYAYYRAGVAFQRKKQAAITGAPHPCCMVIAGGHNPLIIRRERQIHQIRGMPPKHC